MNERQKLFADEYLIDLNAEAAAIRAGYSKAYARGNAYKLIANSGIKAYIEQRMSEKVSTLIATQDEVLRYLTSVMRGESKSSVLARSYDGSEDVIEKGPDEKERLKAAELLGKRYGLYVDNSKLKAEIAVPIFVGEDEFEVVE